MRMLALRRARKPPIDSDPVGRQERCLDAASTTVEKFAYDLGLLMAGRDPAFDQSATREMAERVRVAVRPFLRSGDLMRPDFGGFGELRIDGDLISPTSHVRAAFEFEDRSVRESSDGRLIGSMRRRIRLEMSLSLEPCRVVDCRFIPLP